MNPPSQGEQRRRASSDTVPSLAFRGSCFPRKFALVSFCLAVAACSGNRTATRPPPDYVEVDNPMVTMSSDAPAKIWVPRSYVEEGIPRGGVLLKKGTDKIAENLKKSPEEERTPSSGQTPAAGAASPPIPAVTTAREGTGLPLRTRVAIVEVGHGDAARALYRNLRNANPVLAIDPARFAALSRETALSGSSEKSAFAARLRGEANATIVVYVTSREGTGGTNEVTAEVYDALAGGFLSSFSAGIAPPSAASPASRDDAASSALSPIAEKITEMISLLPWYGRITEVDGDRAYIAAGKESGLRIGQGLNVYRGGRFVEGLGFARGEKVGTVTVAGFVGPDGAFGEIPKGQGIRPSDLVSVE